MPVFPIFLDLERRACLVVGGGAVGSDKARGLAEAGAEVLVVDPSASEAAYALAAADARVTVEARVFRDEDCRDRALVFACTGDASVNDAVVRAAEAAGVLCCRADGSGPVSTGAVLRRGKVCAAVSSGAASPALAAEARDRIATVIGEEYGEAAELFAAVRARLKREVPDAPARAAALARPVVAAVLEALRSGRREDAAGELDRAFEAAVTAARANVEGERCTR